VLLAALLLPPLLARIRAEVKAAAVAVRRGVRRVPRPDVAADPKALLINPD